MLRKIPWLVVAALAAVSCSSTSPTAKDPYGVIWTQVRFTQPPRDTFNYTAYLVRVNSADSAGPWGAIGSHAAGTLDQSCGDYQGIPSPGPGDSLLVQVALVRTVTLDDTVRSPTFQPLTGPTADSAAVWKVVFTDTGTTVTAMPPGTVCGQ